MAKCLCLNRPNQFIPFPSLSKSFVSSCLKWLVGYSGIDAISTNRKRRLGGTSGSFKCEGEGCVDTIKKNKSYKSLQPILQRSRHRNMVVSVLFTTTFDHSEGVDLSGGEESKDLPLNWKYPCWCDLHWSVKHKTNKIGANCGLCMSEYVFCVLLMRFLCEKFQCCRD